MNYDEKTTLAMTGRYDNEAAGTRVLAARRALKLSQQDLGQAIDRSVTTIIAIEKGRQLPSWTLMMWFHNNHRIDANYFVGGEFAQLPGDVQALLFDSLLEVNGGKDAKAS